MSHFSAKTSSGMTLIVAAVIGIALLVLIIWIVCACVAMARHPQTKFGEAMCCRTGERDKGVLVTGNEGVIFSDLREKLKLTLQHFFTFLWTVFEK